MRHCLLLLFVLLVTVVHPIVSVNYSKSEYDDPEEEIKRLIFNYDPHQRPRLPWNNHSNNSVGNDSLAWNREPPLTVLVNLFIISFSSVSLVDMDYTVDMLLRQKWQDPRLKIPHLNGKLSISYLKPQLWIPDLFFRNAKDGHIHHITQPNYLIWLDHEGNLIFSQKLSMKLACPMDLWNFPMDTQICRIEIGSYGYAMEDLRFEWWRSRNDSHGVGLSEDLYLNEFHLPQVKFDSCNKKFKATGAFTCLYVEFRLERKFGFYLIYTFVPSSLVLLICWLSFMIDPSAVPARVSIGLLSMLALMTQSSAIVQKLPRVSYVKAIDVWLFVCLAFVVVSLMEFAIVNSLARQQRNSVYKLNSKRRQRRRRCKCDNTSNMFECMNMELSHAIGQRVASNGAACSDSPLLVNMMNRNTEYPSRSCAPTWGWNNASYRINNPLAKSSLQDARQLDNVFLILFPVGFALFNFIYWIYFVPSLTSV